MKIGSLFAGIGGLEMGLEWAGLGHTVWQAESDEFCRAVLAEHWPDAKRFEDVREVTQETAEPVDILCGGFPCQDISLAGTGKGLYGKRSGLWWEYHRIIRELRPRIVVVENVSALRSRGLAAVLGSLAEVGYDAQWDCIPAQAVGAPHRRDRLFVVAWRVSDPVGDAVRVESERGPGAPQAGDEGDEEFGYVGEAHRAWPPGPDDMHAWGAVPDDIKPAFCRVAHGIPHRAHRLRALGNAVVPQVAQIIGKWIKEAGLV